MMAGVTEQHFMSRVKEALGRDRKTLELPDPEGARVAQADNTRELFVERA